VLADMSPAHLALILHLLVSKFRVVHLELRGGKLDWGKIMLSQDWLPFREDSHVHARAGSSVMLGDSTYFLHLLAARNTQHPSHIHGSHVLVVYWPI